MILMISAWPSEGLRQRSHLVSDIRVGRVHSDSLCGSCLLPDFEDLSMCLQK
jgi:hypothetical protein